MPTNLMKLLNELDNSNQAQSDHEIWIKIHNATFENTSFESEAEKIAFKISEDKGRNVQSEWDFFYPHTTTNGVDGLIEYPKLEEITENMIDYWRGRYEKTNNLYMKVRYIGLVIVFGKKILNNFDCKLMISYIELLIEVCSRSVGNTRNLIRYADRALILAKRIKNSLLINRSILNLILLEKNISDIDNENTWGFCFKILILKKEKNLNKTQKEEIIRDIEEKFKISSEKINTPYLLLSKINLLTEYYRSQGKFECIKEILNNYKLKVEKYIKTVRPIVASSELCNLYDLLIKNDMHFEANQILVALNKNGHEVMGEICTFEINEEISIEDMDKIVKENTVGDFKEVLLKLISKNIISKKYVLEQIENDRDQFPLMRVFSQKTSIDHNGRILSKNNYNSDDDGFVFTEMKKYINLNGCFFDFLLRKIIDENKKSCDDLVDFIYQSPVFKFENRKIIFKGVEAFLNKDHIVAVHLLVPQIESAFRRCIELKSDNILQKNNFDGMNFKTLDNLINSDSLKENYDEETIFYFRAVLSESRGLNIRNDICHGILNAEYIDCNYSLLVMHIILLLAQIKFTPVSHDQ